MSDTPSLAAAAPWTRASLEALLAAPRTSSARRRLAPLELDIAGVRTSAPAFASSLAQRRGTLLDGARGSGISTLLLAIAHDHARLSLRGVRDGDDLAAEQRLPVWLDRDDPDRTPLDQAVDAVSGATPELLDALPLLVLLDTPTTPARLQAWADLARDVRVVARAIPGTGNDARLLPLRPQAAWSWLESQDPVAAPGLAAWLTAQGAWDLAARPRWIEALLAAWLDPSRPDGSPAAVLDRLVLGLAGELGIIAADLLGSLAGLDAPASEADVLQGLAAATTPAGAPDALERLLAAGLLERSAGGVAMTGGSLGAWFGAQWLATAWGRERAIPAPVRQDPLRWERALGFWLGQTRERDAVTDAWLRDTRQAGAGVLVAAAAALEPGVLERARRSLGGSSQREAAARDLAARGLPDAARSLLEEPGVPPTGDPRRLALLADLAHQTGDATLAGTILDGLAASPADPLAARIARATLAGATDPAAALGDLDDVARDVGRLGALLAIARARVHQAAGDHGAALAAARAATAFDLAPPDAWLVRGDLELGWGSAQEAATAFRRAGTEASGPAAALGEARAHEVLGDLTAAARCLEDATARWPRDPRLQTALSRVLRLEGATALAAIHAARATELAPHDPQAWAGIAATRSAQGDVPGALEALAEASRLAPLDSTIALQHLAACRDAGDLDAADAIVARGRLAQPRLAEWPVQAAWLALARQDVEGAAAAREEAGTLGATPAALAALDHALAAARGESGAGPVPAPADADQPAAMEQATAIEAHTTGLPGADAGPAALVPARPGAVILPPPQGEDGHVLALQRSADLAPADPSAQLALGAALLNGGEPARALPALSRAVALAPLDAQARLHLAAAQRQSGDPAAALETLAGLDLDRVRPIQRQAAWAREEALCHQALGEAEAALDAARRAARLRADDPAAWRLCGALARECGRLDEAHVALRTAVTLAPRDAAVLAELATVLELLGRPDDARAQVEAALALAPDQATLHHQAAGILRALLRDTEAARALRRALDLDPGNEAWRRELATLEGTAPAPGPTPAPAPDPEPVAAEPSPTHDPFAGADPARLAADAWRALGDGDAPRAQALLEAIPLAERTAAHWALLGRAASQAGDGVTAQEALAEATAAEPDRAEWWQVRGMAARRAGDLPAARQYLERALALDPSPPLWHALGTVLAAADDHAAATGWYQRALLEAGDTVPAGDRAAWHLDFASSLLALDRLREASHHTSLAGELGAPPQATAPLLARIALARQDPAGSLALLAGQDVRDPLLEAQAMVAAGRPGEARDLLPDLAALPATEVRRRTEAAILAATGDPAGAIEALGPVARSEDATAGDYLHLAGWYEALAQPEDAGVHYRSAVRLAPQDAAVRRAAGRFFLATDDTEAAHLHLASATDLDPADPDGWQLMGQVLDRLGQGDAALRAWERAAGLGAGDRLALPLARMLARAGREQEALAQARRASDALPEDPDAWSLLATLLAAARDVAGAAAAWRQAIALLPEDAELAGRAGEVMAGFGEDRTAYRWLEQAARLEAAGSGTTTWRMALAGFLLARARDAEALDLLRGLDDGIATAPGLRATILRLDGTPDALDQLDALVREHPRDAAVLHQAALARPVRPTGRLAPDSRNDLTVDLLRRAQALAPADIAIGLDLAEALLSMGQQAGALAALEATLPLDLTLRDRIRRADLWRRVQRWPEAIDDITVAQEHSQDPWLAQRRVQLLREAGRSREALAVVTQVASRVPVTPDLEALRAGILLDLGETSGAIEAIEQSLSREPSGPLFLLLGLALERAGRYEAARQAVQEAARLGEDPAMVQQRLAAIDARALLERQRQARRPS